ncbi:hypothetical protein [Actinomadura decatromicini]|uniref:Uncharacterized protein n=1 Tax=Actinomadura decatromicini TaxID=2604572 RepID=A0A5D3FAZ4_9ACTN|nr:hypothetical protein [Actinomadura decatromicini]TYK45212.1 hypothetical protein FXF68_31540 [Actinomadura decatromicini]
MTELEQLREENRRLRLQQLALRNAANVAVSLLENGAPRQEVISHLEAGFTQAPSRVEKAGQS